MLKNFLLPDVFFEISNFHESDVMSLSNDCYLSLASWNDYTQTFVEIKINLNIYLAQCQGYSKC